MRAKKEKRKKNVKLKKQAPGSDFRRWKNKAREESSCMKRHATVADCCL